MSGKREFKRELNLNREYNAPRELVWKAWTDPELVAKWWGPRGITNPKCEVDARPGGKIDIVMLAGKELGPAEGQEWPMTGTFTEVSPEDRLVIYSESRDDVQGISLAYEITVEFKDLGGKTLLNLNIGITKISDEERSMDAVKGMEFGWIQSLEKLEEIFNKS